MINCWRCQVSEDSDVCGDVRLIEVADIVAGDVCGGNVSDDGNGGKVSDAGGEGDNAGDAGNDGGNVGGDEMLMRRCWW